MKFQIGVIIQIRAVPHLNVIRATAVDSFGAELFELGQISLPVCNEDRRAFDDWVKLMTDVFTRLISRETGMQCVRVEAQKPNESNPENN